MIAGIDYGSKLAGTTVIAWVEEQSLRFLQSKKKQDADAMILAWAEEKKPKLIMLDAPLSLPGVYRGMEGHSDYFYRAGDKMLAAMSPMFLGGLTARAMQLAVKLREMEVEVRETYPKQVAAHANLRGVYAKAQKSSTDEFFEQILQTLSLQSRPEDLLTWHHADAALALLSAYRVITEEALAFGDAEEGQIWV